MLITNGKIVTWGKKPQILEGQAIHIQDGMIDEVGAQKYLTAKHDDKEQVDANGQVVMPGNICAHTHLLCTLSRK